jgi:hypothetical protein
LKSFKSIKKNMIKYITWIFLFLTFFVNVWFADLATLQNQLSWVMSKLELTSFSHSIVRTKILNKNWNVIYNSHWTNVYNVFSSLTWVWFFPIFNDLFFNDLYLIENKNLNNSWFFQLWDFIVNNKYKREIWDIAFVLSDITFKFCWEEYFDFYNEWSQIFWNYDNNPDYICVNIYQFSRLVSYKIFRNTESWIANHNITVRNKEWEIVIYNLTKDLNNNFLIPSLILENWKARNWWQKVAGNYINMLIPMGWHLFSNSFSNANLWIWSWFYQNSSNFRNLLTNLNVNVLAWNDWKIKTVYWIYENTWMTKIIPAYHWMIDMRPSFFNQMTWDNNNIFNFSLNNSEYNVNLKFENNANSWTNLSIWNVLWSWNDWLYNTFPYFIKSWNTTEVFNSGSQFAWLIPTFAYLYWQVKYWLNDLSSVNYLYYQNFWFCKFVNWFVLINSCVPVEELVPEYFPHLTKNIVNNSIPAMPSLQWDVTPQTPQNSGAVTVQLWWWEWSNWWWENWVDQLRGNVTDPNFFDPKTIDPGKYNQATKDSISAVSRIIWDPIMCLIPQIDFLQNDSETFFCQPKEWENIDIKKFCDINFWADSAQSNLCQKCKFWLSQNEISILNTFNPFNFWVKRWQFFIWDFMYLNDDSLLFFRKEDIQQLTVLANPTQCDDSSNSFRNNLFWDFDVTCYTAKISWNLWQITNSFTNILGTIFQFTKYEKWDNYSLCPSNFWREMIDKTYNNLFTALDIIIASMTAIMIIGYIYNKKEKIIL